MDHHSAECLRSLAKMSERHEERPHLYLLDYNPYRVSFLPIDFNAPLATDYSEKINGTLVQIYIGSAYGLMRNLLNIAPELGIPLDQDELSDETAQRINNSEPLDEEGFFKLKEERTAWLLLYEGARLAIVQCVALALAG